VVGVSDAVMTPTYSRKHDQSKKTNDPSSVRVGRLVLGGGG